MSHVNEAAAAASRFDPQKLLALGPLVAQMGAKGLLVAARLYLGPLVDRARPREPGKDGVGRVVGADGTPATTDKVAGLDARELAILGLAATKLAYEVGELALYNPKLDPAGKQPVFELDQEGRAPALSLAHVLAAARVFREFSAEREEARAAKLLSARPLALPAQAPSTRARLYAARSEHYATTQRYAYAAPRAQSYAARAEAPYARARLDEGGTTMARTSTSHAGSGCASCGGARTAPPAPIPPTDPCAGGLVAVAPSQENYGGCGCGACRAGAAASKSYASEECPTFAISCETKLALRECAKTALCDFLRCVTDTLCPGGRFDSDRLDPQKNAQLGKDLVDCVGQLACSFMHCVPEVLCPTPPTLPAPSDCVPCDYAVERKS